MNLRSLFPAPRRRPLAAPRALARARRHRRARRPRRRARGRRLHARRARGSGRSGRRALHLGGLQLVPARRPLAVAAQGRPVGGRPRLPRRLLGPPRLEGSLREPRVHRAPGVAAGEQRRPLQLHAAGRRRRPRSHRLVARLGAVAGARPAAAVEVASRSEGDRFVATVTPAAGAPQRLAAYWAVTEQGHVSAVKAGENEGATLHHDFVVRDYEPVRGLERRAAAPRDAQLQAARPPPTRRIRAASTWSSSTPRPADRCRR